LGRDSLLVHLKDVQSGDSLSMGSSFPWYFGFLLFRQRYNRIYILVGNASLSLLAAGQEIYLKWEGGKYSRLETIIT